MKINVWDRDDEPDFESQAEYLDRLGLLEPDELARHDQLNEPIENPGVPVGEHSRRDHDRYGVGRLIGLV